MKEEDLETIKQKVEYINDKVTMLCVWKDDFEERYKSDMGWIKCLLKVIIAILVVLLGLVTYL